LLSPLPWLFAIGALTPPVLWYVHARNLWLTYGNSLGVSNEYHWVGPDVFTDAEQILGLVRVEVLAVWSPPGFVLGCVGATQARTSLGVRLALFWLGAALTFYIAAIRTTSADWAYYYHIASLPAAALLIGSGAEVGWRLRDKRVGLALFSLAIAGICLGELAGIGLLVEKTLKPDPIYREAKMLAPSLSEEGLILVTGSSSIGRTGYPVAFNSSYLFYWLDRRGFSISMEELNLENVRRFQARGARYFIAEKRHLAGVPEFATQLGERYPLFATSEELLVFRLN
jgi:hypothetical protein